MARQNKVRITIRIDADMVAYFRREAETSLKSENPTNYQTLINEALRECLNIRGHLDRILHEERYTVV